MHGIKTTSIRNKSDCLSNINTTSVALKQDTIDSYLIDFLKDVFNRSYMLLAMKQCLCCMITTFNSLALHYIKSLKVFWCLMLSILKARGVSSFLHDPVCGTWLSHGDGSTWPCDSLKLWRLTEEMSVMLRADALPQLPFLSPICLSHMNINEQYWALYSYFMINVRSIFL